MQLCLSCFGSHHLFCPATSCVLLTVPLVNISKTSVDVSFLELRIPITALCLYCTSLSDSIVRRCCSGAFRNCYSFIDKCQKLQIYFV